MPYQALNEDRGARRAAQLRRRFRNVSNGSFRSPGTFEGKTATHGTWRRPSSRLSRYNTFVAWSVIALVVLFFGSSLW